ncbi:DUF5954 family protein [Actinomadura parmotrematis]|uniref:Uncharacterized protein n=1 Tax=Actinomadura parmotrematis TaxID=2864039 RepID=A0ABS7FNE2_9ACTN|nr:DUF5954 family protein [Actinomadura parmotrematis]MBW8481876.1 hypothetical protein [Actinomadura parmotrematis]
MSFDGMAGYDVINLRSEVDPVTAVREQEATERVLVYPRLAGAGTADFGVAEQDGGRWRIAGLDRPTPMSARALLASALRAEEDPDAAALAAEVARHRGRETEWSLRGRRFRIVRVQGFVRLGEDGPEPLRATDEEPAVPYPDRGFVLDPAAPTTSTDAALRLDLANLAPARGTVPEDALREARDALAAYPGIVLLPLDYAAMEERDGSWAPLTGGTGPRVVRERLAVLVPGAADAVAGEGRSEFAVDGRRLRIVRIVRMIRVGADGPEPARPSDGA